MQSVDSPEFKAILNFFYDESVINDDIRYAFFNLLKSGNSIV